MSLSTLFDGYSVEIRGTADKPLFNILDVAQLLGYGRYYAEPLKYIDESEVEWIGIISKANYNIPDRIAFATESALYLYIMRLNTDEAKVFQQRICSQIVQWRRQLITPDMMEERIKVGELDIQKYNHNEEKHADFQRQEWSTSAELANFYIDRYFLDDRCTFPRENVACSVITTIYNMAVRHLEDRHYDTFVRNVSYLLNGQRDIWIIEEQLKKENNITA